MLLENINPSGGIFSCYSHCNFSNVRSELGKVKLQTDFLACRGDDFKEKCIAVAQSQKVEFNEAYC